MKKNELYNQYQNYISQLVSFVSTEENTQNAIAQEERNLVAEIENEYMQTMSELQRVKQTVSNQYKSIWESCITNAGLRRPEAQRPSYTDANWRECVKIQERAAKEIQEWFTKTQQAFAEKQRKMQQEAERKAASALSVAEAERKRKEEAAALEAARGASLLEEMKRKHRNNL